MSDQDCGDERLRLGHERQPQKHEGQPAEQPKVNVNLLTEQAVGLAMTASAGSQAGRYMWPPLSLAAAGSYMWPTLSLAASLLAWRCLLAWLCLLAGFA